MQRSKEHLRGMGRVFAFTLEQIVKNRGNRIALLALTVLAAATLPVAALLQRGTADSGENRVVLENRSNLNIGYGDMTGLSGLSGTEFVPEFEAAEDAARVTVTGEAGSYQVLVSGEDEGWQLEQLRQSAEQAVYRAALRSAGLAEAEWAAGSVQVSTGWLADEDAVQPGQETGEEDGLFWVQYGYAMVVMMLCIMAASSIIRAVVEEKESRLVELLLLSIRPVALMGGKILAMMVFVVGQLVLIALGFAAGGMLTGILFSREALSGTLDAAGQFVPALTAGAGHMAALAAVVLVSLLLAFSGMSVLSGICGACCSTMEDAGSANGAAMAIIMGGYLGSCVVGAIPGEGIAVFSSICPVLSMFCAPVQYAAGRLPLWALLLSWILQLALICGMLWLCGRVYGDLIVYRGQRLKLRQVLRMAKGGTRT